MRVFITGGSGELGVRLGRELADRGHRVTAASRSARPVRGVHVDLESGAGLETTEGHDTVVHLASDPFGTQRVDVEGTQRLVEAAAAAGVDHLVAISIVGIDDHPNPYYRAKLEMERIIEQGAVPWTILRATQFHSLVPRFLDKLPAVGLVPVPRRVHLQPIDVDVVADRLADLVEAGPTGRAADLGGPDVIPLGKMVKDVLRAKRLRRLIVPAPLPRRLGTAMRDGRMLTTPTQRGRSWADYVAGIGPGRDLVGGCRCSPPSFCCPPPCGWRCLRLPSTERWPLRGTERSSVP
ncbi:MAG: NAD(P)H-binding protein [Acidimicrobiia bacterium]|nr:NAD(P)H-binding protein [Acidimicrobiia bacterium]